MSEALAAFAILATLQAAHIIDYRFPERPDLFHDVEVSKDKIEALERDVTALKFRDLR